MTPSKKHSFGPVKKMGPTNKIHVDPLKKRNWPQKKYRSAHYFFLLFMERGILSASVKRFSVSCMRDISFTQFIQNKFGSQETSINKQSFWKTVLTHSITSQPCCLITPIWRSHIYLSLNQIRSRLEKCEIASERIDCPCLTLITGILGDSG